MNILIIGNGFDLAHYLPTKYDHFMGAMQAIEDWNISDGDMIFDDLFKNFYAKEAWFFGYTKAMYKTDDIKLSVDEIEKLKIQLSENVWYQYFSNHVKELKTWIDFETKIEEALEICCEFFEKYESLYKTQGEVSDEIFILKHTSTKHLKISEKHKKVLKLLSILKVEERENTRAPMSGHSNYKISMVETTVINSAFLILGNNYESFQYEKSINNLYAQLESFKKILNIYLMEIIQFLKLESKITYPLSNIEQVLSFNYTKTFTELYELNIPTDFLHGKSGVDQNIVLGVSNISHHILKKFKAYGFVKYHQKLMQNTNYNFILENQKMTNVLKSVQEPLDPEFLKIVLWGHSLETSDGDYIKEIFSLNDDKYQRVRLTIYFYDAQAKFSMLANLIHILGNYKVENWMKKGWLKFEPVPNIADINGLESVSLQTL